MTEATIISWVVAAIVAVLIGRKKNLDPGNYWALGLLLGWIGVVILLCMKPQLPKAPDGMRAVKCVRCNTVQNVSAAVGRQGVDACFRCEAVLPRPWQEEYVNRRGIG